MSPEIQSYNQELNEAESAICQILAEAIHAELTEAESKIWHAHPVWFLNGNPIVGYSQEKKGIRLMFWSGADFDVAGLQVRGGKFKDASVYYQTAAEIDAAALNTWLKKSREIQWDYKNLARKKGVLERIS